jgi:serine/threonine-protein kinase
MSEPGIDLARLTSDSSTAQYIQRKLGNDGEFEKLVGRPVLRWNVDYELVRRLGAGGQGVVYLAEKVGADGLRLPVALKLFSRDPYVDSRTYEADMKRMAHIAAKVALIQQDHLLDVHNFVQLQGIRVMAMEWVDGLDLHYLLSPGTLAGLKTHTSAERWSYLNDVVIAEGQTRSRLKPGVAVAIVRECLAALAALHRGSIVHGDIKPSNIMLKRTGNVKIVDLGAARHLSRDRSRGTFTPRYACPEVLSKGRCTPYSDLVSLGYVLVELLSGCTLFENFRDHGKLIEAKRLLPQKLPGLLPAEVLASESLMHLVQTLITPEPLTRVPGAEAADLVKFGAADFHYELVNGNLASEYETDLRLWLQGVYLHADQEVERDGSETTATFSAVPDSHLPDSQRNTASSSSSNAHASVVAPFRGYSS